MAMNKGGTWERWEDMPSNPNETDTKTIGGISRRTRGSLREVQAGVKAQPQAAMLYTRDGMFQTSCDTSKSHAMCGDAFSNMLEFLLPILEYLSHLSSDSRTVFSTVMLI